MRPFFGGHATEEGAFGSKSADMFPTVAACRIANRLGLPLQDDKGVNRAVRSRRTLTGGLGAQPGQLADAWTTCYGIESLFLTDQPIPVSLPRYLLSLHCDGAFAMANGQKPETWSTAFAIVGLLQSGVALPSPNATLAWLTATLLPTGGFTWSPEWVTRGDADIRATAFVIKALDLAGLIADLRAMVNLDSTIELLTSMQGPEGGFRVNRRQPPCLWGSSEAVVVLDILGERPANADACLSFVKSMQRSDGGYRRGPDYPDHSDLWATMHAVNCRSMLGDHLSDQERAATMAFIESCRVTEGGYTYRPPAMASDVLVTSAAAIAAPITDDRAFQFLRCCRMPGEGGIAFMPARGSEARSALWTVTALARNGRLGEEAGLARWAHAAQNPDGGFGPWEGRASNAVSTNAILEALTVAGFNLSDTIDVPGATYWLTTAMASHSIGDRDADLVELSSILCAANTIKHKLDSRPIRAALATHRRGGSWRRTGRDLPDLLATYVALTAHQALGDLDRVLAAAAGWVRRLPVTASGIAWSNVSSDSGGPLSTALATLILASADRQEPLPNLTL
jgi:prenyltransferase beta subunit